MNKTTFKLSEREEEYLHSTTVENLFINDYLPAAPGDYVKLFLFGLMYAQSNQEMNIQLLQNVLMMKEEDIKNGWIYWEKRGVIKITMEGEDLAIEYPSLIERFYGNDINAKKNNPKWESLVDEEIKMMYSEFEQAKGKTISNEERRKLLDLVKVYNIKADVVSFAIKYCDDINKHNVDYICTVARRWDKEGCRTILDVKDYLDKTNQRYDYYKKVFDEVGFNRNSTPADREIMDRWFDDMGFSIGEVIKACRTTAGKREPTLQYVNRVLENKLLEAGGIKVDKGSKSEQSRIGSNIRIANIARADENKAKVSNKVLKDYYSFLSKRAQDRQDARIDEVCSKIPAMQELYEEENALNEKLFKLSIGGSDRVAREQLKNKRIEIEDCKRKILVEHGYREDYLDRHYKCNLCNDTGETNEGVACVCRPARANEAFEWIRKKR